MRRGDGAPDSTRVPPSSRDSREEGGTRRTSSGGSSSTSSTKSPDSGDLVELVGPTNRMRRTKTCACRGPPRPSGCEVFVIWIDLCTGTPIRRMCVWIYLSTGTSIRRVECVCVWAQEHPSVPSTTSTPCTDDDLDLLCTGLLHTGNSTSGNIDLRGTGIICAG